MFKLILLVLISVISCVRSQQSDNILICKSVTSLFDFVIEGDLDNVPSGIPQENTQNSFQRLRQELKDIKDQMKCLDGVAVGGKCYRLLYRVGVKVTFLQAQNLCTFHGGLVAEIPNEEVYEAVFKYIRRTWSVDLEARNRNFVQVFLSSSYENGRALLRNGEAAYLRWHPRYPTANPNHRRMLLSVTLNTNHPSSENGMFNYNVAYTAMPLCEFTLE